MSTQLFDSTPPPPATARRRDANSGKSSNNAHTRTIYFKPEIAEAVTSAMSATDMSFSAIVNACIGIALPGLVARQGVPTINEE